MGFGGHQVPFESTRSKTRTWWPQDTNNLKIGVIIINIEKVLSIVEWI